MRVRATGEDRDRLLLHGSPPHFSCKPRVLLMVCVGQGRLADGSRGRPRISAGSSRSGRRRARGQRRRRRLRRRCCLDPDRRRRRGRDRRTEGHRWRTRKGDVGTLREWQAVSTSLQRRRARGRRPRGRERPARSARPRTHASFSTHLASLNSPLDLGRRRRCHGLRRSLVLDLVLRVRLGIRNRRPRSRCADRSLNNGPSGRCSPATPPASSSSSRCGDRERRRGDRPGRARVATARGLLKA